VRFARSIAAAVSAALTLAIPSQTVLADRTSFDGGAETAAERGFADPPNADKSAGDYRNPCRNEGFDYHVSQPTGLVRNDSNGTGFSVDGEAVETVATASTPGTSIGFSLGVDDTFVIQSIEWATACAPDQSAGVSQYEPGTTQRWWVTVPTPDAVFPDLLAEVSSRLAAPEVFWPNVDREFGWVYVQVDNDIRIDAVDDVRVSRSVSNLAGSVSVWIQAEPSGITFESGDPDGGIARCSYDQATAPYRLDRATHCSYSYEYSSAGAGFHDAFTTRTTVDWDITASHPLTVDNPTSWRQESVQVAEVQAVEIVQ